MQFLSSIFSNISTIHELIIKPRGVDDRDKNSKQSKANKARHNARESDLMVMVIVVMIMVVIVMMIMEHKEFPGLESLLIFVGMESGRFFCGLSKGGMLIEKENQGEWGECYSKNNPKHRIPTDSLEKLNFHFQSIRLLLVRILLRRKLTMLKCRIRSPQKDKSCSIS